MTQIDPRIQALWDAAQAKRRLIAKSEGDGKYVTDGIFKFSKTGPAINIKTERSVSTLVEILAFLYNRDSSHIKAAKLLNADVDPTWLGASTQSWENDLLVRATQINIIKERAELSAMEETLFTLAPELRKELELADMEKKLGISVGAESEDSSKNES